MTVKPETNFWKSFKKYLDDGKYMSSRIESYVTPGFPDCIVYHESCGFFTVELKVLRRNKKGDAKVLISPLQHAFHVSHSDKGAPVFILVHDPSTRNVKLFEGGQTPKLRDNTNLDDGPPPLYEGPLPGLQLWAIVELRKLPNSPNMEAN
jgi:hypothetical protein